MVVAAIRMMIWLSGVQAQQGCFSGLITAQFDRAAAKERRDASASTPMTAFYGNWKLNLMKSKYDPGSKPNPVLLTILQLGACGNGMVRLLSMGANEHGSPNFTEAIVKPDNNDYPVYSPGSIGALLAGEKPSLGNISIKVIDAHTVEMTSKGNNGMVLMVRTVSVTSDGETLTYITKYLRQGKQIALDSEVYSRIL